MTEKRESIINKAIEVIKRDITLFSIWFVMLIFACAYLYVGSSENSASYVVGMFIIIALIDIKNKDR